MSVVSVEKLIAYAIYVRQAFVFAADMKNNARGPSKYYNQTQRDTHDGP